MNPNTRSRFFSISPNSQTLANPSSLTSENQHQPSSSSLFTPTITSPEPPSPHSSFAIPFAFLVLLAKQPLPFVPSPFAATKQQQRTLLAHLLFSREPTLTASLFSSRVLFCFHPVPSCTWFLKGRKMVSIVVAGKRQLDSGDSSLSMSPPRYKRRKVSAIRDFPDGCGPNAVGIIPQKNKEGICRQKEGDVMRNVEFSAEKNRDLCQVVTQENSEENDQSQNHAVDNKVIEERVDLKEPVHAIGNKVVGEGTNVQPCSLLPYYPMPPDFVWKKLKYPPRRRVSAVRDFPVGCGRNVLKLGDIEEELVGQRERGSKSHGGVYSNNANIIGDTEAVNVFEDKVGLLVSEGVDTLEHCSLGDKAPLSKSYEVKGQEEISEEKIGGQNENEIAQLEYNRKDERDTPNMSDELNKELVVYVKDKNKRKRPIFVPCRNVTMQEEDTMAAGSGNKMVIVQGLMSAHGQVKGLVKTSTMAVMEKNKGLVPYEFKGQEEIFEEKSSGQNENEMEQLVYNRKDKRDTSDMPDELNKEPVVYAEDKNKRKKSIGVPYRNVRLQEESTVAVGNGNKNLIVQGLMSALHCPWSQGKGVVTPTTATVKKNKGKKKCDFSGQDTRKHSPNKSKDDTENLTEKSMMIIPYPEEHVDEVSRPLDTRDNDDSSENDDLDDFQLLPRARLYDISLPPFGPSSSSERGIRSKVRETLRLFQAVHRKLLQEEETKSKDQENESKRTDLRAAKVLKDRGMYLNTKKVIGSVPGVEVGDIFNYRIELAIIGLHGPLQAGIDTIKLDKEPVAISIVASGGYANDVDSSDVLIYTGQGGNASGKDKQPEDQKLEKGNLALKNCIDKKTLVRVIRGFKETKPQETPGVKPKMIATYTYDGLYTVDKYWQDLGPHGKLVYKFELNRLPGQSELAWKEVNHSKRYTAHEGRNVADISGGKENFPICAINTIDDETPPSFVYITSIMYPDWCQPIPPKGCNCKTGCSDSEHCPCALKNGGEIPFNFNGAIVQAKPLVYECGPLCKCPPSCHNRVSQHGFKLPLEVFKTSSMGWGVRCRSAIPSGTFICEYIGELLDDKEAEQRTGSDEYLFDIGQNYNDTALWDGLSALLPDLTSSTDDVINVGFTIDAARYGNIGRFINHSCSPNLYAQNVLYDHEDKRIPHIMFFAAENIPPLQELTYHYNYTIDQVYDSEGNIKKKSCFCGSAECTGRMY